MKCQDASAYIADHLAGTLPGEQLDALRAHAAVCATCRAELAAAEETWAQLGRIPPLAPDLGTMRTRFDAMLAVYKEDVAGPALPARGAVTPRHRVLAAVAAGALLVIGVGIGRQTAPVSAPATDPQMAAMREELREVRQMMSLSLLQQQSATARLQGVIAVQQIADPRSDVIATLLDTLANDPNPNVRLATIDVMRRFMDRDVVKRRALEALPRQKSPLVQIALIDFVVESAGVDSVGALRTLASDTTVAAAVRTRAAQALRRLGAQA